jgi:DNA-binding CsgD family transcriptional regulator
LRHAPTSETPRSPGSKRQDGLLPTFEDYFVSRDRREVRFQFYLDLFREFLRLIDEAGKSLNQRLSLTFRGDIADNQAAAEADVAFYVGLRQDLRRLQRSCPVGTLFGDLLVVLTPLLSDAKRVLAANRVADQLGRVIHPRRWRWVKPVLHELIHGPDLKAGLREIILARLFEAAELAANYSLSQGDEVKRQLRRQINDAATKDFLGPEWRRRFHETRDLDEMLRPDPLSFQGVSHLETRLTLDRLVRQAHLTRAEAEVFALVRCGATSEEVATQLSKAPTTVRVLLLRSKAKMRRAVGSQ